MEEAGLGPAPEDSSWSLEEQTQNTEVQSTAIIFGIQISLYSFQHVAVANYPAEKP